jgi:FMN reductase
MHRKPLVVGLGGTIRPGSSSELILRSTLTYLQQNGAEAMTFSGHDLMLPMYEPSTACRAPEAERLIAAVQRCDAVVIVSPGYHGSVSGLIKNALDYFEDLNDDVRPYLQGRPVGCIGCAYGWQAAASTLSALRTIIHSLRGWPTPMGGVINTSPPFMIDGAPSPEVERQMRTISDQILRFAVKT